MMQVSTFAGRPARVHVFLPGLREQVQGRLGGTVTGADGDVLEIRLQGNWFRAEWYGAVLVVEIDAGDDLIRFAAEALPVPGGQRLRVRLGPASRGQRRQGPRVDLNCPGRLRMASGIAWEVLLRNVGPGGALVSCLRRPDLGDRVELAFSPAGFRPVGGLLGRVIRVTPLRHGRVAAALQFDHVPPGARVVLADRIGCGVT